ncbi:MAG TPA: hypothetical protein VGM91_00595 [Conexibacter sp.]
MIRRQRSWRLQPTFGRNDADQELSSIGVDLLMGLLERVSNPTLCGDALAADGTRDAESLIGSVTTAAGPGAPPLYPAAARRGGFVVVAEISGRVSPRAPPTADD